jgi:hypothetical protein
VTEAERVVWLRGYDYGLGYAGGYDLTNDRTADLVIKMVVDLEQYLWSDPAELYLRGWVDGMTDAVLSAT